MNPNAAFPTVLTFVIMALPVVFIAGILMLTARSTRGIVFGISLPLDVAGGPLIHAAIRRYQRAVAMIAALSLLILGVLFVWHHVIAAVAVRLTAIVAILGVAIAMRVREAARLRPMAAHPPLTRTADLTPASGADTFAVGIASLLPLAASALWLRAHWNAIPARWPRHWDAQGRINGWSTRTTGSVMLPLIMGAAIICLLLLVALFIARAPGSDNARRLRFLAPLCAMTWLFALLFSVIALTPLFDPTSPKPILIAVVIHVLAMFAIVVWAIVRSGIMSTHTSNARSVSLPDYDGTPDAAWHAGIFYYNPADPAVVVPKRFGLGWTLNFGRPLAWVYTAVILLFAIGIAILPFALH